MGYREFVKDYKIDYVDRPGSKRQKAVRVYVGPWYEFTASPEKIRFLRWLYLSGMVALAVLLLIPMCIDCVLTRIWYIQVPASAAGIPMVFAVCATWRLWTAGQKMNREHNSLLGSRMKGACLFLMILPGISCAGSIHGLLTKTVSARDYLVCACYILALATAVILFSQRKGLDTQMTDPGENKKSKK